MGWRHEGPDQICCGGCSLAKLESDGCSRITRNCVANPIRHSRTTLLCGSRPLDAIGNTETLFSAVRQCQPAGCGKRHTPVNEAITQFQSQHQADAATIQRLQAISCSKMGDGILRIRLRGERYRDSKRDTNFRPFYLGLPVKIFP